MKNALFIFFVSLFFVACSSTWNGVKDDAKGAKEWTKEKVNKGATYIKEKTE
ncbi:hypothetical protein CPIN18021_0435 [Campylobacter pinnipediorum subsp. caledonicus]|uniref:Lipoprotein n=1 Tax=Campylobacter pinnipediorum subsp. caledonicus TaxID=1874362 RepID=A0A1S6U697_9BACT|nr:hypothetical protein [Campylobacter pinnipediorum]AQW85666.1 hypothetical protein CPIN18020_0430 [Campylobacter pinnipediorum subsp. caledonicus]AQW87276.1 hypothetical protein CPIN18021_0435 [Campylobacter pinnipediorum subsp. caledonicus]